MLGRPPPRLRLVPLPAQTRTTSPPMGHRGCSIRFPVRPIRLQGRSSGTSDCPERVHIGNRCGWPCLQPQVLRCRNSGFHRPGWMGEKPSNPTRSNFPFERDVDRNNWEFADWNVLRGNHPGGTDQTRPRDSCEECTHGTRTRLQQFKPRNSTRVRTPIRQLRDSLCTLCRPRLERRLYGTNCVHAIGRCASLVESSPMFPWHSSRRLTTRSLIILTSETYVHRARQT